MRTLIIFDFDDTLIFGTNKCFFDAIKEVFGDNNIWATFFNIIEKNGCGLPFVDWVEEKFSKDKRNEFIKKFQELREEINLPKTTIPMLKSLKEIEGVDLVLLSVRDSKSVKIDVERYKIAEYFIGIYGNDSLGGFAKPHVGAPHLAGEYAVENSFNRQKKIGNGNEKLKIGYDKVYFIGDSINSDMVCALKIPNIKPVLIKEKLNNENSKFLADNSTVEYVKSHEELFKYFKERKVIKSIPLPLENSKSCCLIL